jgi:hypothetical protein
MWGRVVMARLQTHSEAGIEMMTMGFELVAANMQLAIVTVISRWVNVWKF